MIENLGGCFRDVERFNISIELCRSRIRPNIGSFAAEAVELRHSWTVTIVQSFLIHVQPDPYNSKNWSVGARHWP
ncbi:hypothetical protein ACVWYH_007869 [Bradyrhizobium sp. GM24.11]